MKDSKNENCRLNGCQLQILKDPSTNLCKKKRRNLLVGTRLVRHHSNNIAVRYVSQISVASNCYLNVDIFQLLVSLPLCLD